MDNPAHTPSTLPPPPWEPEHVVDVDLAWKLLHRQFPGMQWGAIRPFGAGWDNTIFLVDDQWIFRFPRRTVAIPGLLREIAVLSIIQEVLPVAVPTPIWIGTVSAEFPFPFTGSRFIQGVSIASLHLNAQDEVAIAHSLGSALKALHQIPITPKLTSVLPYDPMLRGTPVERVKKTRETLSVLMTQCPITEHRALCSILEEAEDLGADTSHNEVLVHGDLHLHHVLISPTMKLSGIIDWGDVCRGDPAIDFAIGYAAFTGKARAALWEGYGIEPSPLQELRAKVLAIFLCSALAAYAAHHHHNASLAEILRGFSCITA